MRQKRRTSLLLFIPVIIGVLLIFIVYNQADQPSPVEKKPKNLRTTADIILLGARDQAKKRVRYDAAYAVMSYPNGDVAEDIGACTDVVIRAFREAKIDLQELMHEDMKNNFTLYPSYYGLDAPDSNIDHRRVRNQMVFFQRFGEVLPVTVTDQLETWQWGDIVCWRCSDGQLHTGIVSDKKNRQGIPLVIHNNSVTREEDCLERWEIIGHYRYPVNNSE